MRKIYSTLLISLAFALSACGGGGGGGSSSEDMPTTGNGGGDMTMDCPEGQSKNSAGACVADGPTPPTAEELADEAELVAKAIGNDSVNDFKKAGQFIGDGISGAGLQGADIDIDAKDVHQFTNPPTAPGVTPVVRNQFTASDDSPATIMKWSGTRHTRSREENTVMDTVISYTDIKPKSDEDYADYYADGETPNGVTTGNPGTGSTQRTVTLGESIAMLADQIVAEKFPDQPLQTFTFEDDSTTPTADESRVPGTLHGIPGIFDCAGSCTVVTDKDGKLSMTGGTDDWTFIPAEPAQGSKHIVRGVTPDTDYMNFGYWLEDTTNTDGTTSYQVSAFARGSMPVTTIPDVRGSASYDGPATGLYMQKRVNDDGSVSPLKSGQFTASASLTAYFGDTTADDEGGVGQIAPNLVNSINGSISGFKDSEGNDLPSTWTVTLMKAQLTGDTFDNGVFTGDTTGEGTWRGQFFGPTTDAEDAPIQPGSVGGAFDGHFTNGHVAGAFGAYKKGQ